MIVNAARQLGRWPPPASRCASSASACRRPPPTSPAGSTTPPPVLVYESGCIGSKPQRLPLSIGDGELAETADAVVSVPEIFAYWLQAGRDRPRVPRWRPARQVRQHQLDRDRRLPLTANAAAGRRRRARDRRVGRGSDGDHATVASGHSSNAATSGRRWGSATVPAIASGSGSAAVACAG